MFYSHCLLSRKGPLGSIWVAAYYFKKLKKAQVTSTDISSSVDKILQDGFDVVTYRVLAYLLLGVVRIYSKKVEYLFDDCNKVLLNIKDFVLCNKDGILVETLQAPYFSITLPERFELDAFDLEIIEDTSEGNVMPHEEITLKDGMWKTRGVGKYSLNQDHCEEFAVRGDTWSAGYSMNEDVFSSHLVDVMEQGTLCSVSTLQASMEKLQGSMFSHHECEDLEMFLAVEEEPTNTRKSFVEDHLTNEEDSKVPDKIGSDETHAGMSVLKLCDDSVCQEASLNLEMFGGVVEEPGKLAKRYHQSEEPQKEVPGVEQSENETQSILNDVNVSDVEVSIEKLLESRFFQEECMDANTFLAVEEPPEHARPFNEEHQSNAGNTSLPETTTLGKRKQQLVSEDHPLYIKLDTTPQSKFKDVSGANTPEFMVISTPAAKEHARVLRKRKCFFDDVVVFPNNVIKECIENTGDLVSKRRKLPHTAFAVWKACRFSNLDKCFLEPLIPCASLELGSLFRTKKLQIPETVKSVGGSVEIEEPSKKLDASESQNIGGSVENTEHLEKLNVSGSPLFGRLDETVETTENMLIQESAGILESPKKFVSEYPTSARLVETMELSDMSESCTVGRSVETVETLEKSNVSGSPSASRFAETLKRPGKLDVAESPTAGGSLEQMAIAPETPIQCTTLVRSFESPERPDIYDADGLWSKTVEKEICRSLDQELDFNLLNEDTNTSGGNQEHYGWSERTRVAVKCLHASFLIQKKRRQEEVLNLLRILEGRTKRESARLFYEILVLKSKGYVDVKEENLYGDILIWKTPQWNQACRS
ncbi:PREDICTED: sister chromatid cohesion 1 protein 2 [Populus euphratica]|uniref:Sister chromatid cohesion 1 protein 2 n=1 Tax=Populus euphratica TaxID=75702 RepID=A0AAJ6TPL4_POPEU|nr:PREDICTED: sister chromatid cohesion 1 protein 2 [Populus euphratica]